MTSNIERRVQEHKKGLMGGFTKKYNCRKLVFAEQISDAYTATEHERQLKNWNRKKKEWLIESINPEWEDLSLNI